MEEIKIIEIDASKFPDKELRDLLDTIREFAVVSEGDRDRAYAKLLFYLANRWKGREILSITLDYISIDGMPSKILIKPQKTKDKDTAVAKTTTPLSSV